MRRPLMLFAPAISAFAFADGTLLPVEIKPADPHLHYNARFDPRNREAPSVSFPGSELIVRFEGTALNARLRTTGEDRIQVVVDGEPGKVLALTKEPALYEIASGLPRGEHVVILHKRTEAFHGTTQFLGLQIEADAKMLDAPHASRFIEFIGDSITCGYGNEAANQNEHFKPETSNHYLTYASIASRALGAEHVAVAVSGIRLTEPKGEEGIPSVYKRVHLLDRGFAWNFAVGPKPDVVVINLGTNDFARDEPAEAWWKETCMTFLDFVRSKRPDAHIFLTNGPMMGPGAKLDHLRQWNRDIVARRTAAGDAKIHALDFPTQNPADGLGADWHPSVKTHEKMAAQLIASIKEATGW